MNRRWVVVGRDDGNGFALFVLLSKMGQGHSLVWVLNLWSAIDGVLWDIAHAPKEERGGSGCKDSSEFGREGHMNTG